MPCGHAFVPRAKRWPIVPLTTSVDLKAGQIVTVDWRKEPDDPAQYPQPPEPNKLRPSVVVQDS